jgi:hypothetical protein
VYLHGFYFSYLVHTYIHTHTHGKSLHNSFQVPCNVRTGGMWEHTRIDEHVRGQNKRIKISVRTSADTRKFGRHTDGWTNNIKTDFQQTG